MLLASAVPAGAAKLMFGTDEHIRAIQDVSITGQNGEPLYLAHKYSFHSFIAPYRLTDEGYVLGVKGNSKNYYRLDQPTIERLQARGLLPSPLPPYEISWMDYAFGHLAWLIGAGILATIPFSMRRKKRAKRVAEHFNRGFANEQQDNLDGAVADYTSAIALDPKCVPALVNRGLVHTRRGAYDLAIADFTRVTSLGTKDVKANAFSDRGFAHEGKGDFGRAIADHTRAIQISKKAIAYFRRGGALLRMGDLPGAVADYSKAIELEPGAAVAYQARGTAYEKQGDAEAASADFRIAAEIAGQQAQPA
jgi:tetratricopeptide (TPR) repeat protein